MRNNKKVIIDTKSGNITDEYSNDKVILMGEYPFEGSPYIDNVEIILESENKEPIKIDFPYSGYSLQLFVGDFTNDNKSEIMIRGGFGGSGGFEIGVIYKYEDGKLVDIFNQDTFYKNNTCKAKFKDDYKVSVYCGDKKYMIDISDREKNYLNQIYTEDKKVKYPSDPYVDNLYGIYPIKQVYNDYYELLIQQRVVGIVNADTLGVMQSGLNLTDKSPKIIYQGVFVPTYYFRKRKLRKRYK